MQYPDSIKLNNTAIIDDTLYKSFFIHFLFWRGSSNKLTTAFVKLHANVRPGWWHDCLSKSFRPPNDSLLRQTSPPNRLNGWRRPTEVRASSARPTCLVLPESMQLTIESFFTRHQWLLPKPQTSAKLLLFVDQQPLRHLMFFVPLLFCRRYRRRLMLLTTPNVGVACLSLVFPGSTAPK
jgi:hypothetical protein